MVFVPDVEEFTVVGLDHMNRAVDGDVALRPGWRPWTMWLGGDEERQM